MRRQLTRRAEASANPEPASQPGLPGLTRPVESGRGQRTSVAGVGGESQRGLLRPAAHRSACGWLARRLAEGSLCPLVEAGTASRGGLQSSGMDFGRDAQHDFAACRLLRRLTKIPGGCQIVFDGCVKVGFELRHRLAVEGDDVVDVPDAPDVRLRARTACGASPCKLLFGGARTRERAVSSVGCDSGHLVVRGNPGHASVMAAAVACGTTS